jgi:hypothetical protein
MAGLPFIVREAGIFYEEVIDMQTIPGPGNTWTTHMTL